MELEPSRPKPPLGHWALILILGACLLAQGLILNQKESIIQSYEEGLKEEVTQVGDLINLHSKCEMDLLLYKTIVEELTKEKKQEPQPQAQPQPKKERSL